MSNLIPFKFKDSSVRVITDSNKNIWFVASDVAKALGYDQPHKAVLAHCKKAKLLIEIDGINHTVQQNQSLEIDPKAKLIPESDVYRLVMRSKLESAEVFQEWVVEEVIPSIRKTGGYSIQPSLPDFNNPIAAARAWADELEAKQSALAQIEADRPKVKFAEVVTESSNTRCVRVWVKTMKDENNLTVGEREVFGWLVDRGYIYRQEKGYLPKARYEANGLNYFTVSIDIINGRPRRQLKITGKGVVALTSKVVDHFKREAA